MADESTITPAETTPAPKETKRKETTPEQIYLVSYPKVVFLYPTFLVALVSAISLVFIQDGPRPDPSNSVEVAFSLIFLLVLAVNLVVLGFDFPRTTSITLFFLAAAVVLGLILLFTLKPNLVPSLKGILTAFHPVANPTFYFLVTGMLGLIFIGVLISVRWDYWEVRPNELLHHHGVLSNLERFSAPHLKIEKEIGDVFEYMLLRSGRLILTTRDSPRPIILENVLFISKKEARLTRMLGALQVQVRHTD